MQRLVFERPSPECQAFEHRYTGVRFNRVELWFQSCRIGEDDEMLAGFNVSGSAASLLEHRFVADQWLSTMPVCGANSKCSTEGFGRATSVHRTKGGFRVDWARYDDGLNRVADVMFRPIWEGIAARLRAR